MIQARGKAGHGGRLTTLNFRPGAVTTLNFVHVLLFYQVIFSVNKQGSMGPLKCYVTLEGVGICPSVTKRYEALRGGGGGYVSVTYRGNAYFFLANTAWFTGMSPRPTRIST